MAGDLRPRDRLPREADLAETLGLSRNSLREAVKALSLIRVLVVRQGDGTYVTSLALVVCLAQILDVIARAESRAGPTDPACRQLLRSASRFATEFDA